MRNIFALISLDAGSFDMFSLLNVSKHSEEFLLCPNITPCVAVFVILLLQVNGNLTTVFSVIYTNLCLYMTYCFNSRTGKRRNV